MTTRREVLTLLAAATVMPRFTQAADLGDIRARGTLKVLAVRQDPTPEFFSVTGGEPGFDREILEAFGRAQGVKVDFVALTSWDELLPSLLEGKGDLIAGRVSNTPARARLIDFTAEVFPTRDMIFTVAPQPVISTRAELLALPKIGTLRGSSMVESLRALGVPDAKIAFPAVPEKFPEMMANREWPAGAWVLEAAMVWQRRIPGMQIGMFLGEPQSLAYGVKKGSPQLLAALNDHLKLVRQSGTWNRLTVKYFGEQAPEILRRARTSA
jgi:ABC-type amino acid transport substrate-binding protein